MRKSKRILLIVTGVLVAWIAWGLWPPPLKGNLKVENWPLVKVGMTQAEVEELLGGPPGNYGRYGEYGCAWTKEGYPRSSGIEKNWWNDNTYFHIWFGDDGLVTGMCQHAGYDQFAPPNMMGRWTNYVARTYRSWK